MKAELKKIANLTYSKRRKAIKNWFKSLDEEIKKELEKALEDSPHWKTSLTLKKLIDLYVGYKKFGNYVSENLYKGFELLEKNKSHDRFKIPLQKGITIYTLSLAPHKVSTYNTCPHAGICKAICLGDNGRNGNRQMFKRIKRTLLFLKNRNLFLAKLIEEILYTIKIAKDKRKDKRLDLDVVFRLNNFSDILWENIKFRPVDIFNLEDRYTDLVQFEVLRNLFEGNLDFYRRGGYKYKNETLANKLKEAYKVENTNSFPKLNMEEKISIFELFPDIWFYDYTKHPNRENIPPNYHLTFSYDKGNAKKEKNYKDNIPKDKNLAVIVSETLKNDLIKNSDWKDKVIDGDENDCRILDDDKKLILLSYRKGDLDREYLAKYLKKSENKINPEEEIALTPDEFKKFSKEIRFIN